MGALALLAPEAAARIWNFPLKDSALARIVGPPGIALGVLCLIIARDLDRYRAVAWVPFLGTWLQFGRAVHGLWSGELAPAVATSQIVWEGPRPRTRPGPQDEPVANQLVERLPHGKVLTAKGHRAIFVANRTYRVHFRRRERLPLYLDVH